MQGLVVMIACLVFSASAWAGELHVSGAWIRLLPAGAPAGGFFSLNNTGKEPVTLTGASSPDFSKVMLHKTVEKGGVSKMMAVHKLEVPAGGKVQFRPGGYHLMLMRAAHTIRLGSSVPVVLHFAGGQQLTAQFRVRGPSAK